MSIAKVVHFILTLLHSKVSGIRHQSWLSSTHQPLALSSLQTLAGLYPVALAVQPLVQAQKAGADAVAGVQEPQAHRDREIRPLYSMITKTQLTGK